MYVPSKLMVAGDAQATAELITDNTMLFRVGILGSLMVQILFAIIALKLNQVLGWANKNLGILMVCFALVSIPITMYNDVHKLSALALLDQPQQMMDVLELHARGMSISTIFWGLWLFPLGQLVIKSGYMPKLVGWALFLGGIGYTMGSILTILDIKTDTLFTITEAMTFGEIIFVLWLIIGGFKIAKQD